MKEGAANLVDHVLPTGVALRQWVLTHPFVLRFSLAFDARLLGAVHRLFADTVAAFYRERAAKTRGATKAECGGLNTTATLKREMNGVDNLAAPSETCR